MGWSGNSLGIHINKEHRLGGESNVFWLISQRDFVNRLLQTSLTKGFNSLHSRAKHMKSWQWLVCPCLQPAMLRRGMQMEGSEGFSYRRSGLTNTDYAELLLCLWPLQLIQLRDQQEFFCFVFNQVPRLFSQSRKMQEADWTKCKKTNLLSIFCGLWLRWVRRRHVCSDHSIKSFFSWAITKMCTQAAT